MEYSATSKYVRVGTRKVRLVADAIRTMSPDRALTYLDAMGRSAARPVAGVIRSALANAKEKLAKTEALTIGTIEVMGGPVMKRWHAVSRGSAHAYKRRMTHIRVTLTDEARNPKSRDPQS